MRCRGTGSGHHHYDYHGCPAAVPGNRLSVVCDDTDRTCQLGGVIAVKESASFSALADWYTGGTAVDPANRFGFN
jgi:hypothetical protein